MTEQSSPINKPDDTVAHTWDQYFTGDPNKSIAVEDGIPLYDDIYPDPLPRHVKKMLQMGKESIDAAAKRGDKKAYFFEDGCGTGRYRSVAEKLANYAKNKGYDMHIIWIGNDVAQQGLDLFKNKLEKEGYKDGHGHSLFPLETKTPCVTKGNLTFKFIKSTSKTTAQELEKNIGVIVENCFSLFGIDGYRVDKAQRIEMMEMRGRISRNEIFLTVQGPAYLKAVRNYDLENTTSLTDSPNTIAILQAGDITSKRGEVVFNCHTFTEDEINQHLKSAKLEGKILVSNTIHEREGLIASKEINRLDEIATAQANQSTDPFIRAYNAVYWEVTAKSSLQKNPLTGRVFSSEREKLMQAATASKGL